MKAPDCKTNVLEYLFVYLVYFACPVITRKPLNNLSVSSNIKMFMLELTQLTDESFILICKEKRCSENMEMGVLDEGATFTTVLEIKVCKKKMYG